MAPQAKVFVRSAFSVFFEYDTPKIVHIRSKKVGVINRLIQLTIIAYIIGYVIVYQKGYQEFDEVQGVVTTKLKGVVFTNFSNVPGLQGRIWDVADYVVPPQENGAFFVMTNVLITPEQTQGVCEEDPGVPDGICSDSKPCIAGQPVINGDGVKTNECVTSSRNSSVKVCKIHAWCPVELDNNSTETPYPALQESRNFTVFIKNNIEFPKFDVRRRNILGFDNDQELAMCRFDPNDAKNKFCPIFNLHEIVALTGVTDYSQISKTGGVIQIIINWDCNLDFSEDDCLPQYSFRRLDRPDFKIAKGFNFRFAYHYKLDNGTDMRTLFKAYGIRFVVLVNGRAGQFRIVPLLLNVGSGLALLSIATILCDIIALYVLKAKHFYRDAKYQDVKGQDAYEVMSESYSEDSQGPRQRVKTGDGETNNSDLYQDS